jgi:pimeloyl-ACP methyl ester carboxylesterase
VAERLADLGPQVRFSYPGFGDAPPDDSVRSLGDLYRWLLARLPAGPCHLVAQSMGGVLATRLAIEEPARILTLTLTATSGGVDVGALGGFDWRPGFRAEHPDFPTWFERDRTDLSGRLAEIRAPTLILHGDADPICPPAVPAFLAARIPGARKALIPGGTHAFARERPDEVAPLARAHVTHGVGGSAQP